MKANQQTYKSKLLSKNSLIALAAVILLGSSQNALAQAQWNTTGNNISNANTIGFKSGSVTFSDIFADSRGVRLNGAGSPIQVGNGVEVGAVNTRFVQGGLNATNTSSW